MRQTLEDTDLQQLYNQLNQEKFDGKLPMVEVKFDTIPPPDGTTINPLGLYSPEKRLIQISDYLKDRPFEIRHILLHEMCHICCGPNEDDEFKNYWIRVDREWAIATIHNSLFIDEILERTHRK